MRPMKIRLLRRLAGEPRFGYVRYTSHSAALYFWCWSLCISPVRPT